jgi:VanZ family protein
MLVMTVLFLVPHEFVSGAIFDWWDKAQHALAFGVLMLLGYFAYPKYFWRLVIGLTVYGVVIELIQSWAGWRQGDVMDALADMVGVLLMGLLIKAHQSNWAGWAGRSN